MYRKLSALFCLFFAILLITGQKSKVVVLGVGHSSQLINYHQQPAAIRAFINKVKPSAICIERAPEEFAKNDFYEFTYEQQYLTIPYSIENKIPLHPIDWMPPESDTELGFGIKNLEVPRFIRQKEGFLGFTTFSEKKDFEDSLYFADKKSYAEGIASWYSLHQDKTASDLPRRMFLYRTYLQAGRIKKVLENYSGSDTILVIVGAFHKNDIEKNLSENGYSIIQPSSFGVISESDIRDQFRKEDAYAILSFNLLGMQSHLRKINEKLVECAFEHLANEKSVESQFLEVRRSVLFEKITSRQSIVRYLELLDKAEQEQWVWTGVKDKSRIDSYFDPFGNLSLKDRIRLELAREYRKCSKLKDFQKHFDIISSNLSPYKKAMFDIYTEKYLNL